MSGATCQVLLRRTGEHRIRAVLAARWARRLDVLAGDMNRARDEAEANHWLVVMDFAEDVYQEVGEACVSLAVEAADAAHATRVAADETAGVAVGVVGGAGFADVARAWADDARAAADRVADLRPTDRPPADDDTQTN